MELRGKSQLVRIFIGDGDSIGHQALYEVIVRRAKEAGLAGATVLRGLTGYGASNIIRNTRMFEFSSDLPVLIEIVDTEEKIAEFLPVLDGLVEEAGAGALVTMEQVNVIRYVSKRSEIMN